MSSLFCFSQNSKRYAGQVSFRFLFFMVALVLLVSSCGIAYASIKNKQVGRMTEIDTLHRDIAACNMSANQYRAKTNALMNRWAILDRLSQDGSDLHDIDRNQIEMAQRDDSGILTANTPPSQH